MKARYLLCMTLVLAAPLASALAGPVEELQLVVDFRLTVVEDPHVLFVDAELMDEYSAEYTIGVDREVFPNVLVGATAIYRKKDLSGETIFADPVQLNVEPAIGQLTLTGLDLTGIPPTMIFPLLQLTYLADTDGGEVDTEFFDGLDDLAAIRKLDSFDPTTSPNSATVQLFGQVENTTDFVNIVGEVTGITLVPSPSSFLLATQALLLLCIPCRSRCYLPVRKFSREKPVVTWVSPRSVHLNLSKKLQSRQRLVR